MIESRGTEHTIGQDGDNFLHLLLETYFEYPICFVNHECLQIPEYEAFRVLTASVSETHPLRNTVRVPPSDPKAVQA